jgi:hypothetical protein
VLPCFAVCLQAFSAVPIQAHHAVYIQAYHAVYIQASCAVQIQAYYAAQLEANYASHLNCIENTAYWQQVNGLQDKSHPLNHPSYMHPLVST